MWKLIKDFPQSQRIHPAFWKDRRIRSDSLLPTRPLSAEVELLCGAGRDVASAARESRRDGEAGSLELLSLLWLSNQQIPQKLLPRSTITQFGKGFGGQGWWLNEIPSKVGLEIQVLRL